MILESKKNELSRNHIQNICDSKLHTCDKDWILEYVLDPLSKIKEEFNRYWKEEILKDINREFSLIYNKYKSML